MTHQEIVLKIQSVENKKEEFRRQRDILRVELANTPRGTVGSENDKRRTRIGEEIGELNSLLLSVEFERNKLYEMLESANTVCPLDSTGKKSKTSIDDKKDFYAWLLKNAQLMRNRHFSEVDAAEIAETLESMSRNEIRTLSHLLAVLLAQLLQWQFQAVNRSKSWKNKITIQRIDIEEFLNENSSLRYDIVQKIDIIYEKAKLSAEAETGIDMRYFPEKCPFSLAQIIDREFLPDSDSTL